MSDMYEQRKNNSFAFAFIDALNEGLASELDESYGKAEYEFILKKVKDMGIRVFRNSNGKHKLKLRTVEK